MEGRSECQVQASPLSDDATEPDALLGRAAELARSGDRQAVAQLYASLYPRLQRYFRHRLRAHEALAEDLTADVFVKLLSGLETYTECGLPFSAWIFRVAHNRLIDHLRAQRRRPQLPLESVLDAADHRPEQEIGVVIDRQTLRMALEQLTPEQRSVIVLRYLHHLTLGETALVLGRSEDSVKKLQHRGLVALRRVLSGRRRRGSPLGRS